jgi:hypothetical protein
MMAGAIGFVSLIGGVFLGSFLIKKYKWHIKECAIFITATLFLTSFLFLGLIIYCPQEKYVNSQSEIYTSMENCNCDSNSFYPMCYRKEFLFQTPCHAGCRHFSYRDGYTDCVVLNALIASHSHVYSTTTTVLPYNATTTPPSSSQPPVHHAYFGTCTRPARHCMLNLVIVSAVGLLVLFLSSIVLLPILRIILESVNPENQSFALGIRSLITKLFGNIPGPLIFASIVDKSCVQWTTNSYNSNRTCRLYDNKSFSLGLGLLGFSFRLISALFAFVTLVLIRRTKSVDFPPPLTPLPKSASTSINQEQQQQTTTTATATTYMAPSPNSTSTASSISSSATLTSKPTNNQADCIDLADINSYVTENDNKKSNQIIEF